MKTQEYIKKAQQAVEDLEVTADLAIQEQEEAMVKNRVDIRLDLLKIIETVLLPPADAVGGIISTYAALIYRPAERSGNWLIRSLNSTVDRHMLPLDQVKTIISAFMAGVTGKASGGLIDWPTADEWHKDLSTDNLRLWARAVDAEAYEKLEKGGREATTRRMRARSLLVQLETAKAALEALVPADNGKLTIVNKAAQKVGVPGVCLEPGESHELSADEYVKLENHNGFIHKLENGLMEVTA
jgi:hypothetical protein